MDPRITWGAAVVAFALALAACTILTALGRMTEGSYVSILSLGLPTLIGGAAVHSAAHAIAAPALVRAKTGAA